MTKSLVLCTSALSALFSSDFVTSYRPDCTIIITTYADSFADLFCPVLTKHLTKHIGTCTILQIAERVAGDKWPMDMLIPVSCRGWVSRWLFFSPTRKLYEDRITLSAIRRVRP